MLAPGVDMAGCCWLGEGRANLDARVTEAGGRLLAWGLANLALEDDEGWPRKRRDIA